MKLLAYGALAATLSVLLTIAVVGGYHYDHGLMQSCLALES